MGSTRAARRAGISPAHNATTPSESAAAPNTNGSRALIWNRSQVHQLIRFVHRQRPQKNLVEDRKDCHIRANTERHGQHGNGADDRRFE